MPFEITQFELYAKYIFSRPDNKNKYYTISEVCDLLEIEHEKEDLTLENNQFVEFFVEK